MFLLNVHIGIRKQPVLIVQIKGRESRILKDLNSLVRLVNISVNFTNKMGFGRIKLDPNDILFSKMVRERDGKCLFCFKGPEWKLECSHFWGRGNKATRWDPSNAETLCFQCHAKNEANKQGFYREWKLKQIGEEGYRLLELKHDTIKPYGKYEKKLLNEILKEQYKNGDHLKKDWKVEW